ncbi:MAG: phosphate acyltransferase [Parabacteroides merdae]
MNILTCKKGTFFIADTLINRHPSTEVLIDIARLTQDAVKFFAHEPVMAMLSLLQLRFRASRVAR